MSRVSYTLINKIPNRFQWKFTESPHRNPKVSLTIIDNNRSYKWHGNSEEEILNIPDKNITELKQFIEQNTIV